MKLHLGCGNIRIEGWTNVDWNSSEYVDIVDNVSTLETIEKDTIEEIYACHVLEHFGLDDNIEQPTVKTVLRRWYSVLRPGGILYVSVPNLLKILEGINENSNDNNKVYDFLRCCYGGQNYKGNTHYSGFTPNYLKNTLETIGFRNITNFNSFVNDTSRFILHGKEISINYKATKL